MHEQDQFLEGILNPSYLKQQISGNRQNNFGNNSIQQKKIFFQSISQSRLQNISSSFSKDQSSNKQIFFQMQFQDQKLSQNLRMCKKSPANKIKKKSIKIIQTYMVRQLIKYFQQNFQSIQGTDSQKQALKDQINTIVLSNSSYQQSYNLSTLKLLLGKIDSKWRRKLMHKALFYMIYTQVPNNRQIKCKIEYINCLKSYRYRCKSSVLIERLQIREL